MQVRTRSACREPLNREQDSIGGESIENDSIGDDSMPRAILSCALEDEKPAAPSSLRG